MRPRQDVDQTRRDSQGGDEQGNKKMIRLPVCFLENNRPCGCDDQRCQQHHAAEAK